MATLGARTYPDGIRSGRILIAESQLMRMPIDARKDFVPIRVARDVIMYRYKHATEPYTGKRYDPVAVAKAAGRRMEATDDWDVQFAALVEQFVYTLDQAPGSLVFMVEGDEDEDFTYGAFSCAVAEKQYVISDWLLEREFGNTYSVRHISIALNELTDDD